MKYTKNILGSLILLAISSATYAQMAILSGPKQASQYRFVQDIASIVGPSLDFEIVNTETLGAAANFDQLVDPKSPFKVAIIQSDFLYYMQTQDMRLNTSKTKDLKVILPLGGQQIHLVTKPSKGYKGLKDLEKQKVAIGSVEQGTYRTAFLIKERSNVNWTAVNTHFEDAFGALNINDIDAFFIVSSSPIEKLDVNPQTMVDKLALVPLVDFNDWAKYYKPDTIHKSEYKWLDNDIPTFSVPTVLVVNESKLQTEDDRNEIMKLRSAIQNNNEKLKTNGHPKWKEINLYEWTNSDWPMFK